MNTSIKGFIDSLNINTISEERKTVLAPFVTYLKQKRTKEEPIKLNFICTHNSRRSQLAQVWAATIGAYFDIPLKSFSGGVEVTACNERTIASLKRTGFETHSEGEGNPKYTVSFGNDPEKDLVLFSKLFDDVANPKEGFAALMTCSDADDNCPFVPGCEQRISLTYKDPKEFDDTSREQEMYDERSKQIATEMKYVFSRLEI
jgi:arsenate reductase